MSEVEGEEGENDAKRESDVSTAPETDDIGIKKKKKSNTSSVVWKWFGKSDKEQTKPVCKICQRLIPTRTGIFSIT